MHPEKQTHDPFQSGAVDSIIEPLTRKEGIRHLWLGDSRQGKTTANRILIDYIRKRKLVDVVLSIDDKNRWAPQYKGTYRSNPQHLISSPPMPGEDKTNIVFRGVAHTLDANDGVDPESVAVMGWSLIRATPCTVLVNIDELADATNGHQSWSRSADSDKPVVPQLYRKGGGVGLSVVATTQMPQLLPREAFGLSDTIGIFRMTAREATYLAGYRVIDKADIDTIEALQVGEWLLFQKSMPKDEKIYKFSGVK